MVNHKMKIGVVAMATISAMASSVHAGIPVMAGYTPAEDVTEHALIDEDVAEIETLAKAGNFSDAKAVFRDGEYSFKDRNSIPPVLRTLQGFSEGLAPSDGAKSTNVALPEYDLFVSYYGNNEFYSRDFVVDALDGTGSVTGLDDDVRAQLAIKGAQYQVVLMYALYELYSSIAKCQSTDSATRAKAPKAWDEGMAFFAGQRVGADGRTGGKLQYTLAEKRASQFGTTSGSAAATGPVSDANIAAVDAFKRGLGFVQNEDCASALQEVLIIRKHMQIPLIQGLLVYAYKSDARNTADSSTKAMAEGWAFAAGVLPFMNAKNPAETARIRSEMEIKTGVSQTVPGGFEKVFEDVYAVLPALCISCEEIGIAGLSTANIPSATKPTCTTDAELLKAGCDEALRPELPEDDKLSTELVIGLAVAGAILIGVMVFFIFKLNKLKAEDERDKKVAVASSKMESKPQQV